jgi:uncharacterized membrane protein
VGVDVVTQIEIRRPLEQVAEFAADPGNAPAWYTRIASVDWLTPPPLAHGSRVRFVARFLGRRLEYVYEIVEHVPGARLVMRTAQGPFPMETTYTWSAHGDSRTRMTLRNRGEPAGAPRLAAPLVAMAMRRANRQDLRRLKRLLEAAR